MIKGFCNKSFSIIGSSQARFEAGIERFYVPDDKAKHLEDLLRFNKAGVVLSITKDGKAQVKDLLINKRSWKEQ